MTFQSVKQKLFPVELRIVDIIVYCFWSVLILVLSISKSEWIVPIVKKLLMSLGVLFAVVFTVISYRQLTKLGTTQSRSIIILHVLTGIGVGIIGLNLLLHPSPEAIVKISLILFLGIGLFSFVRVLYYVSRSIIQRASVILADRRKVASVRVFLTGGFSVLGLMQSGRKRIFLSAIILWLVLIVYTGIVLLLHKLYWQAGTLVVVSFIADALIEGVMYAEVAERSGVESELLAARNMQMSLMPTHDPVVKGFDISGICLPASEVGGDFFDYVWLDKKKTKLGIALADVSGKAMKAAITAVMTSGMIYRELEGNQWPKAILQRINKPMYAKLSRGTFTAMSFAVIETKKKTLAFSNAGQMRPILKRGEKTKYIKADGLPLGVLEETTYSEATVKLKKGDVVVFYTDGINEAMNEQQEQFELERLESAVHNLTIEMTTRQIIDSIFDQVKAFTGAAKQHDDMTVVVVKVL
jgi:serine phosphatase RsbU (regulator of sigma subunit)